MEQRESVGISFLTDGQSEADIYTLTTDECNLCFGNRAHSACMIRLMELFISLY